MGFDSLAVWDALKYFDTPADSIVTLGAANAPQKILSFDQKRVVAIIGNPSATAVIIGISGKISSSLGWPVRDLTGPLILTHAQLGPIVQGDIWAAGALNAQFYLTEIKLRDWPEADPLEEYNGKRAAAEYRLRGVRRSKQDVNPGQLTSQAVDNLLSAYRKSNPLF